MKKYTRRKWTSVFRENLVKNLVKSDEIILSESIQTEKYHVLTKIKSRGRCFSCYKDMMLQGGLDHAQKITRQVTTKCNICVTFFLYAMFLQYPKGKKTIR